MLSLSELFVAWAKPEEENYYKIKKHMLAGSFSTTTNGITTDYLVADWSTGYYSYDHAISFYRSPAYHDYFWLYQMKIRGHWSWAETKALQIAVLYGAKIGSSNPIYVEIAEWEYNKGLIAENPDVSNHYDIFGTDNIPGWLVASAQISGYNGDSNAPIVLGTKVDSTYYVAGCVYRLTTSFIKCWNAITKDISNGNFVKINNYIERDEVSVPGLETESSVYQYRDPKTTNVVCADSSTSGSLTPGNTYNIRVMAQKGTRLYSTCDNVSWTLGSGKTAIDITWDSYSGATKYYIIAKVGSYYYECGNTTGTSFTITSIGSYPRNGYSENTDEWYVTFGTDTLIAFKDGKITKIRYQIAKDSDFTDIMWDITETNKNFWVTVMTPVSLTLGDRYFRCKYIWDTGEQGDWSDYIVVSYEGSASSKDTIVNGDTKKRFIDDILYYDSYIYVLTHYDESTIGGIELYKINPSDLSIVTTYTVDGINLTRVRLQKDDNDLYLIYIANTQGYTSHLYYRKQSESFNTDHEISLPESYHAFKDACIMQVDVKSYIVVNAYYITEDSYNRGRFLVHDVAKNETTKYDDTHPFYDGWLEKDPEEQGIWYECNWGDDKAEMQQIRYLTLSEPISRNYTLPIWGRIDRR